MSDHDAELVQEVATKVARAELIKRGLIAITAVLVGAVLVGQLVVLNAVRKTQETGSPTLVAIADQQDDIEQAINQAKTAATSSTQLLDLILDCFDPESECAKKSAADRAAQVGAYNAAVIAAHYCTDQILASTYTLDQLTECVVARLDGREGDTP